MKKAVFLLIAVLIVGLLAWNSKKEKEEAQPTFQAQVNSKGAVTIEVTPVNLARGEEAIFQVSLNTHLVELSPDLKGSTIIIDNKGNEYKPVSWDGGTEGHHLSGNLTFPPLGKDTKSLQLKIRNIAGIERIFSWNL